MTPLIDFLLTVDQKVYRKRSQQVQQADGFRRSITHFPQHDEKINVAPFITVSAHGRPKLNDLYRLSR
jgi:hypothetical protein